MPFGNQSADFFVLLKMDMTCHKDITIFRMIIMISQDDLDHRLLPEIIHGGYDGPLSDECWKGHGLLGLQFRCFFSPLLTAAEARCLATRCNQVCFSIMLTYAFLSGCFLQHCCPLASKSRPVQQQVSFFFEKKTYHEFRYDLDVPALSSSGK